MTKRGKSGMEHYLERFEESEFLWLARVYRKQAKDDLDLTVEEFAINEGVGIILPADDLVSASQILYSTISDDDWMTNAGLSARRLAATRFSMDKHAADLEKVLERAAAAS